VNFAVLPFWAAMIVAPKNELVILLFFIIFEPRVE
jgi:hypothetical protein